MQRWIPVLAIALVLQLVLAVGLGLRANPLAAQRPDTPLVQAVVSGADRLLIEGPAPAQTAGEKTAQVEVVRKNGAWTLPGYFDAPASASKVQSLLDRIAKVRRGFPIATTQDALKRFKVAPDTYERHLLVSQDGKTLTSLYLGSSPGLRKADARTAADDAVYTVELATYEMPVKASDWLDPELLKRDPDSLASLALTWPGGAGLALERDSAKGDHPKPTWKSEGLPAGQSLDPTRAEALVQAVSGLRVDGVLGTQVKPEWQQDQPDLTLRLRNQKGEEVTWTLSKPKTGDFQVLKASDRPWYLELKQWSAKPLLDAAVHDKLVVADKTATAPAAAGESGAAPAGVQAGAEAPKQPDQAAMAPTAVTDQLRAGVPAQPARQPPQAVPTEAVPAVGSEPPAQPDPAKQERPAAPVPPE